MDCYFVNFIPNELKPANTFKEAIAELLGSCWWFDLGKIGLRMPGVIRCRWVQNFAPEAHVKSIHRSSAVFSAQDPRRSSWSLLLFFVHCYVKVS